MNLGDAAPVEDFIGPLIVANVPGKGRGILVQRDVHRGGGVIRIMMKSGGEDLGECCSWSILQLCCPCCLGRVGFWMISV